MTSINLRPWREERNERLHKRLVTRLAVSAALAASIIIASMAYLDAMFERQNDRNAFLNQEITRLDTQLKEIQALKTKRERLLERLSAIQELQGNRPLIVRSLDELVDVLPEGVHYSSVTRSGESIAMVGLAATNEDVSALMRTLNESVWFGEPALSQVTAQSGLRRFNLSVPLDRPQIEESRP